MLMNMNSVTKVNSLSNVSSCLFINDKWCPFHIFFLIEKLFYTLFILP